MQPCFRIYQTEVKFSIMSSSHHGKETTSRNVSAVYFITKAKVKLFLCLTKHLAKTH